MNNELIKEFARQAGFKVNWQHEDMQAIKMAQYKEFAELIVRECVECSNELAKHYINNHSEQEQVFLLASIADYSNEIKKHFGVEE
jgi:hypothetical protein